MQKVRTRIAPSPTGPLHIGTARTALFNYLFAKSNGGVFVLRIEDTDLERSDKKYEKDIIDSLDWLGITHDEGPAAGGEFAPYRQSERVGTYQRHLEALLEKGGAFYCFHTEAELEAEREKFLTEKIPPIHVCEYRDAEKKDIERFFGERKEGIIRFRTPENRKIIFSDLVRGEISFDSHLLGDFSIAKDLKTPLYNFAVAVDDHEMNISHVIRGEDHIPNTPKQILVQEALSFTRPAYAHLPLILGTDRSKLSKRHGATSIQEYRAHGYLPEALVNFMALLGWSPGTDQEIFSMKELERKFDILNVQKSGAVFNIEKLDWLNGEYIRKRSLEEIVKLALQFLPREAAEKDGEYLRKVIELEQPRLKRLSEIGEKSDYFFREPEYDKELLRWKSMSDEEIKESLELSEVLVNEMADTDFTAKTLGEKFFTDVSGRRPEERILKFIEAKRHTNGGLSWNVGPVFWPLRAALTGKKASPGPFEVMEIIGRKKSLMRMETAKKKLA